jgi:CheY-like chemotaxis protein
MFVDDEATLRDLTSEFLVSRGYTVHSFVNGERAWEAFTTDPDQWDLIITDQTMPVLTGLELIEKIRSYPSDIPILLCTGYSDSVSPGDLTRLGISNLLQKPTSLKELLKHVRKALHGVH